MKTALLVLCALILSQSALAESARKVYACVGDSDPDSYSVDLFVSNGTTFAAIEQVYGDGDDFAADVVVLKKLDDGNDAMMSFVEDESDPRLVAVARTLGLEKKPTGRTHGLRLRIAFTGGDSSLETTSLPNGELLRDSQELDCTRR